MPVDTVTAFRAYDLPSEGPAGHQFILDQIGSARKSLRLFMYGWTDPMTADAIAAAWKRQIDLKIILDHTQSTTPTEVSLLHRFLLQVPAALVRITTSQKHQIMHRKVCVIDGNADVPDAEYETVDDATASGYPRTITGSTNWSPTAFRQTNDLICIPGKAYAGIVMQQFSTLWDWATANEPAYQPTGATA